MGAGLGDFDGDRAAFFAGVRRRLPVLVCERD